MMTPEDLSYEKLLNFLSQDSTPETELIDHDSVMFHQNYLVSSSLQDQRAEEFPVAQRGKKRRRRKARVCKNKEEAEMQRLTHIAVERNRRKQMNEHLAVLRALMPESYAQRGDQASVVGGAIEYIKVLEHILQSLAAQKRHSTLEQNPENPQPGSSNLERKTPTSSSLPLLPIPHENAENALRSSMKDSMANIDVRLFETHANIKIIFKRKRRICSMISRLVAALHSLGLSVLHLNATTSMEDLLIYSINAKIEESCQLSSDCSVEDIASAVHHVLRIIEESI